MSDQVGDRQFRLSDSDAAAVQSISPEWVVAVARQAIGAVEPRELAIFDSAAVSWLAGERRKARRPGAGVGSGLEALLLSEIIFPIIASAFGEILGNTLWDRIKPRPKPRHKRSAAKEIDAVPLPASTAISLTNPQAEALRDALLRQGTEQGLAVATAGDLADAVLRAVGSPVGPGSR